MTALWTILGPPTVVDLSHHNAEPIDFTALYASGVRMVIHKATQGSGFIDPMYARRRPLAIAAGLKWEAYAFADDSPPEAQKGHFLSVADLDNTMRGAIDIELSRGSTISPAQADALADILDQRLGYQVVRYGGAGFLSEATVFDTPHLRKGPWWWSKYGPIMTAAWLARLGIDYSDLVLWQETESGQVLGVAGNVDLSYYLPGRPDSLEQWPALSRFPMSGSPTPISVPVPVPATPRSGDAVAFVRAFQADHPPLVVDGDPGPLTWAALDVLRAREQGSRIVAALLDDLRLRAKPGDP